MAFICSSCRIQTWRVFWYLLIKGESNFLPCSSAVSLTYCCDQEEHNFLPQGPQSQPCLPSQGRQYFLLSNRIIETVHSVGLFFCFSAHLWEHRCPDKGIHLKLPSQDWGKAHLEHLPLNWAFSKELANSKKGASSCKGTRESPPA